ncbi:MAG: aspartate 1-decarboxylase [Nitrospina sp.]|jgi:aspartate 1-decarboxylase|nr:aspartate 1-decarboxylase [Nitrospina sp.]MBT5631479.1 aspartate 1-decarboxylase [Nitrospina sp.]
MQRTMLKSKLHRARVTATEIDYEGSIAIDEDLLDRVGILPLEQVHIYNINTGTRFITYVIAAERGSGIFSINGAAARLAQINDRIIVVAYGIMDTDQESHKAQVVLLDAENKIVGN